MGKQSLKERTAKGLLWGGLSNGAQQVLNLFFGVFLARLLSVEDYGMVGMLSIFSLIAGSLQESGFIAALANKREVFHRDYNAVFWFSAGLGACLYGVLFCCAPLIARFYGVPELVPLARYSFLGFFVASLGVAPSAYLFRHLLVKQKAVAVTAALAVSGTVGVGMAYFGFAYWGIATQSIVYVATVNVFYWSFVPWRPAFSFHFAAVKELFAFSSKLVVTNVFNHLNNNLLSVLLGRFYTGQEVGFFTQANKWNSMGHSLVSGMVNSVAQPVLSGVSDDEARQRRVFRKMLRFTAFVSFPAMLGLALIAPELIAIAITDKWLPSVPILQTLCIGGAFLPLIHLYSNLIISKGKSNVYMWNTVCLGIVQLLVLLWLSPFGIRTMVPVYVAIGIAWLPVWHYFVWKEIRLSGWDALKDILPFAVLAAGVLVATYYVTRGISNPYLLLVGKIVTAALLYATTMWLSGSVTFRESWDYVMRKRGQR